jgi:hypothetical protein
VERVDRLFDSSRACASRTRPRGEASTAEALLRMTRREEKATMLLIEVVEMFDGLLSSWAVGFFICPLIAPKPVDYFWQWSDNSGNMIP